MKKTYRFVWIILIIAALALSACGGGNEPSDGNGAGTADRPEPPAEYAGMTNPFEEGDTAAVQAGQQLFSTNCASCHGETGQGDGPAAASLDPMPQDLSSEADALAGDYMFWRISEGGTMAPFNSAMPAWKGVLSEEQIWQVITFIRTLND